MKLSIFATTNVTVSLVRNATDLAQASGIMAIIGQMTDPSTPKRHNDKKEHPKSVSCP